MQLQQAWGPKDQLRKIWRTYTTFCWEECGATKIHNSTCLTCKEDLLAAATAALPELGMKLMELGMKWGVDVGMR